MAASALPLLIFLGLMSSSTAADCPSNKWQLFGDSCYVLLPGLFKNQAEALAACREVQPDATLPSVHSRDQNDFVNGVATSGECTDIWLGLTRVNRSAFAWQDGSEVEYANWLGDEPNGTGDCVYMDFFTGQWRDINCFTPHFYVVCQYISQA